MRGSAVLLVASLSLAGCADAPVATEAVPTAQPDLAAMSTGPSGAGDQLADLRQLTVKFHDFQAAKDAGWDVKVTPCMVSAAGGMGFHYGNSHHIDGDVRADEPELLLYEPMKNGKMRLVAVEYIILYTEHPRDAEPPMLFGQEFTQNDDFGLWGLHAWIWQGNPNGTFASWNPNVSCDNTTDVMTM